MTWLNWVELAVLGVVLIIGTVIKIIMNRKLESIDGSQGIISNDGEDGKIVGVFPNEKKEQPKKSSKNGLKKIPKIDLTNIGLKISQSKLGQKIWQKKSDRTKPGKKK